MRFLLHPLKEAWYYMPAPKAITHRDVVSDSTKLSASANVTEPGLLEALIDPDEGVMRPGAMPSVTTSSAAGSKSLLDAVAKATPACYMGWQITK